MTKNNIIHCIVEQMKLLMKDNDLYHRDFKFLRLSKGNIKIMNKEECKGCILYYKDYCDEDILNETDEWYKHKLHIVKKLKKKHYDYYFDCKEKCIKFKGVIGPFNFNNKLNCLYPVNIKNMKTGEDIVIPEDVYIQKLILQRNPCEGNVTKGTGIVIGVVDSKKENILKNFIKLHEEPGIYSDQLNEYLEGSNKTIIINVNQLGNGVNHAFIKPHYLVAKCALGKEINNGAINVLVKCHEIIN